MNPETKALMRMYDENNAWEFPSQCDTDDIERRARAVYGELCGHFDHLAFEGWIYHQDASFGLAIVFPPQPLPPDSFMAASVRFSNFGNLATLIFEEQLAENAKPIIVDSLSKHGFTFVDARELMNEAYDGIMSSDPCIPTWWVRYFDWI
ncbi:MAG: hypothetical protein Q4G28_07720 [Neisseria sp.]|nr:hypothetical protein [Neisseria sp.]